MTSDSHNLILTVYNIIQIAMAWYQSEQQKIELKSLLTERPINPICLLSHEQFTKQISKEDPDVLSFIQKNYQVIVQEMLVFCLRMPQDSDSEDRKFKYPKQAISFFELIFETCSTKNTMTSSITSSVAMNKISTCKIYNPEIVSFVIQKMFVILFENGPKKLMSTMIPGYFNQLFMFLVHSHQQIIVNSLKNTKYFEELIRNYSQFPQLVACVQEVLIVFFGQGNMIASMASCTNASMKIQSNYPMYMKYQILMLINQKLVEGQSSYGKQNLLNILIEVLKNNQGICDGTLIVGEICKLENISLYWKIANENNKDEYEHELKALQLIKWIVKCNSSPDKSHIIEKLSQIISLILNSKKITIKFILFLEILIQWINAESSIMGVMNSVQNMQKSLSQSGSMFLSANSRPLNFEVQKILTQKPIFAHLLKTCINNPQNNILHKKVEKLFFVVFQAQSQVIIDNIYKENNIIYESICELKNFKTQGFYGSFINIIEIYSKRRIDTMTVKQAIKNNDKKWNQVFVQVLEPYAKKLNGKLGQMNGVASEKQTQYTVQKNRKQTSLTETVSNILSSKVQKQKEEKPQEKKEVEEEENAKPITINLTKNKKQDGENENQQKSQNESFQNFMKKRMSETSINFRKKSKTPTKLKSTKQKKNRWGEGSSEEESRRKSVSSNAKIQKIKENVFENEELIKPQPIKLIKIKKEQYPVKVKERKMTQERDLKLISWLKRCQSAKTKQIR